MERVAVEMEGGGWIPDGRAGFSRACDGGGCGAEEGDQLTEGGGTGARRDDVGEGVGCFRVQ